MSPDSRFKSQLSNPSNRQNGRRSNHEQPRPYDHRCQRDLLILCDCQRCPPLPRQSKNQISHLLRRLSHHSRIGKTSVSHHPQNIVYAVVTQLTANLSQIVTLGVTTNNIVGAAIAGIGENEIYRTDAEAPGFPLPQELLPQGQVMFALQILHTCAMPLVKASILAFYSRIFDSRNWFKAAVWVLSGYIFVWWLGILLATIFQCNPVSDNWVSRTSLLCLQTTTFSSNPHPLLTQYTPPRSLPPLSSPSHHHHHHHHPFSSPNQRLFSLR